ncbi:MAG: DJ-1/PfpI family protein [Gemmataceae bacterium]|nr:DJ-1/PfpI family protein [Gemmataceae bacterium]
MSLLKSLSRLFRSGASASHKPARFHPQMEFLEAREMLAANLAAGANMDTLVDADRIRKLARQATESSRPASNKVAIEVSKEVMNPAPTKIALPQVGVIVPIVAAKQDAVPVKTSAPPVVSQPVKSPTTPVTKSPEPVKKAPEPAKPAKPATPVPVKPSAPTPPAPVATPPAAPTLPAPIVPAPSTPPAPVTTTPTPPATPAPVVPAPAETVPAPVVTTPATPTPPAPAAPTPAAPAAPLPVLLVIANRDFYYKEYGDTRAALEAAGLRVVVAASTLTTAIPHPNSGQGSGTGAVQPDVAITGASAANYSAIAFVGGWGASSYQYAFNGTYWNSMYNGSEAVRTATNGLIADFVHQGKHVAAICHGVSVLAWARVDGASLLTGRTVSTYPGYSPGYTLNGVSHGVDPGRILIEANGATAVASRSVGDPRTSADDVVVDGKIITAEDWDSATRFGQVIAQQVSQ